MNPRQEVLIDYTNWRGVRSWRRVVPDRIVFENSEWHPETQWIMYATDLDMAVERGFAMKDIHTWKAAGLVTDEVRGIATG